jgi:adenylate kinase
MKVPRADLIERLGGRRSCPRDGASYHVKFSPPRVENVCDVCGGALAVRADDRPEAITKRLETYERDTKPLIDHYARQGALRTVDGVGDLEAILERITRALEA